ncbi:archaetidylserine decarboxylase [Legionella spiritensis]|uniref:Phosphatidylserine decarboxylase proenzyme n=1 Tax=Legionella spiritensis TaxID=452 RepID=A0A0W0ZB57_LEGSP|nr:archaetidylserine decarboxylase [Legionella spiritensis]KTD66343.1 phosphatidylserine decarboxylase [Legionella spiritensis]SNV48720.1 phosphatidylserine decarboxylase [Legionella spiritensis]VEG91555.1 phosphatidylserine decarboxylase [Legionella spiritensis]
MANDFLKTLPQFMIPKHGLTSFAGAVADVRVPAVKNFIIKRFIAKYGVDMSEAREENPENYPTFNDFFIRRLKSGIRPIADASVVSPVDGIVSELGSVKQGQLLQAKGRFYDVGEFLGCEPALFQPFINGCFATLYLSPKDYHRIHMPVDAKIRSMTYIPGQLFSVQPSTVRVIPRLFARNERLVVYCDTPLGLMAMVLVGATIVGAIATSWHGEIPRCKSIQRFDYSTSPIALQKGDEMGYFKLGSTVVLLFADGERLNWTSSLHAGSGIRYGQALVD